MDCENCLHLTVVCLHDTGPRSQLHFSLLQLRSQKVRQECGTGVFFLSSAFRRPFAENNNYTEDSIIESFPSLKSRGFQVESESVIFSLPDFCLALSRFTALPLYRKESTARGSVHLVLRAGVKDRGPPLTLQQWESKRGGEGVGVEDEMRVGVHLTV